MNKIIVETGDGVSMQFALRLINQAMDDERPKDGYCSMFTNEKTGDRWIVHSHANKASEKFFVYKQSR